MREVANEISAAISQGEEIADEVSAAISSPWDSADKLFEAILFAETTPCYKNLRSEAEKIKANSFNLSLIL